ncbi:MAG: hypothetical protein H6Q68_287 [Firmicutes bacterium]|nr:hypothetical protein [Bacillota bacterium]
MSTLGIPKVLAEDSKAPFKSVRTKVYINGYVPLELQRNFSKDAAVSIEYHAGGREKGVEAKYTRRIDNLFLLF